MKWPTEELRNSFRFNSYVLVSKIYKHKNADKKNRLSSDSEEAIIYVNPEDEIFHKLSLWSFNFPFHAEQVTAHELKNYRPMGLVMAVEADKVSLVASFDFFPDGSNFAVTWFTRKFMETVR
uniref:Uncharacterized protein n=1 Tax=Salix viminalis TaxID=40686 RepID=A0A6N2N745_SALVM